jgi:MSHA biogenesis protein MshJ
MKKLNWESMMKWLNARHPRERVILLVAGLGILGMVWLTFVHDVLTAAKAEESRNITIAEGRFAEEQNRQNEIRTTYTTDPNVYAQTRQRELRDAANEAAARLAQLYGDLISPQQMAQVLVTLLQRETTLNLVSLNNSPSEALINTAAASADGTASGVQVFKHGLHLVFEGSFMDTVYYLRSLEALDSNFFWENLEFDLGEYPEGEISLDIYTLSTEQGWIGV